MNKYSKSFKIELENDNLDCKTIKAYLRDIDEFMKFIDRDIKTVNITDINNYINYLDSLGRAYETINRKLTSIRKYINHLNAEYALGIKIKIKKKKIPTEEYLIDMLSEEDFFKLVDEAYKADDKRAIAIFYTLLFTGVRVSEMLQLRPQDTKKDRVKIIGKMDIPRQVIITDELKKILKDYMKVRKKGCNNKANKYKFDRLFTGNRGNITRQTVNRIIKKYAKLAKVRLKVASAHKFRHLCAILMLEEFTLDKVKKQLGHSNINTTARYTQETLESARRNINNYHKKFTTRKRR